VPALPDNYKGCPYSLNLFETHPGSSSAMALIRIYDFSLALLCHKPSPPQPLSQGERVRVREVLFLGDVQRFIPISINFSSLYKV
jgi:hypothetical protein